MTTRQLTCKGLSLILILGYLGPSAAQAATNSLFPPQVAQRLDAQLAAILHQYNLPSVEVGVEVPGKGHYTFVGGFANLQTRLPRRLDEPFRIASVTKPFAATAILILVDRGSLRKSDPIAKWYPSFPNATLITIDDLLRMRSGIPAPNDDEVLAQVYDAPLAPAPPLEAEIGVLRETQESVQTAEYVRGLHGLQL